MAWNVAGAEFVPASDRSLLVSFGGGISEEASRRVAALTRTLATDPIPHVSNIHPAYCSVLVVFDPVRASHEDLVREVTARLDAGAPAPEGRTVEIPVCYGGEFGPDLETVAAAHGLTIGRTVELHSGATYTAQFLGFVPGYAYLSGVPGEIVTPRLDTPRRRVPAGSVAIAGKQAGIYPFATPGGWRILGRTPLTVFQPDRDPMNLISLGDRVRFVPITRHQFEEAAR